MSDLKYYLGDGAYVDIEDGMLKLTTENGIEVTNTIFLGGSELDRLEEYIEVHKV